MQALTSNEPGDGRAYDSTEDEFLGLVVINGALRCGALLEPCESLHNNTTLAEMHIKHTDTPSSLLASFENSPQGIDCLEQTEENHAEPILHRLPPVNAETAEAAQWPQLFASQELSAPWLPWQEEQSRVQPPALSTEQKFAASHLHNNYTTTTDLAAHRQYIDDYTPIPDTDNVHIGQWRTQY